MTTFTASRVTPDAVAPPFRQMEQICVRLFFVVIDSLDDKIIDNGQMQSAHAINEHEPLRLSLTTLTQFNQILDLIVLQAGQSWSH
jgi:hypothetical protein